MRLGLVAAAFASLAACALPEPADSLDPRPAARVGRPVLELAWQRVVHDRREDHAPQEFAGVAVQPGQTVQSPDGTLYVGSLAGELWALDARRGEPRWKKKLGAISSQPLVDDETVYVGTDDGQLVALETATGKERWRYATRGAVLQPPVIHGDLILFANDADRVYALEVKTGKWRWEYERDTPDEFTVRGHGGVAVVAGTAYAGFADGHVVALAAATGDVTWVRSLAGEQTQFVDVDTTPVVADGVLYAASSSGGLYALEAASGAERWRADIAGASEVTLDGERLYVAAAETGLFALDRAGHVLWRQGLSRAGDPSAPVVDGTYLYVTTASAGLFIVDKRSGGLVQSFDPGNGITAGPTIAGRRMYVLSNGGVLYALNLRRF
jgi:outer membrane protein assembly factor BamB